MSTYTDASLIVTPNAKKAGKLYALKGADLDVVRATTATYVGSDGLIKTALANESRFDYTNGSCPSILVEPQRTNLLLRSEEFNNVAWGKTNTTISADSSTTTDPIGGNSSDALFETTNNAYHSVVTASIVTAASNGTTYTFSVYLKANNRTKGYLSVVNGGGFSTFDLTAKTNVFGGNGTNETVTGQKITELANGWFRLSITSTFSGAANVRPVVGINNDAGVSSYAGNTTKGFFIWGAQIEAGVNATSYIPTVASTVTRNADVISKTGLSGITSITETFENGTTNVISGSPTSYTMSQGRIKHVIGI